jgi:hypothetical protein
VESPAGPGPPGSIYYEETASLMEFSADRTRDERPFQRLLVTLVPLSLLALLAWVFVRGEGPLVWLQAGVALAGVIYVVTFLDITLGLGILILCTALSPEVSVGGLDDLRLEDFLVPALAISWAGRSMLQRDEATPSLIGTPAMVAALICLLATLAGSALGSTQPRTAGLHLMKYAEYLLIYLLFANNVRTREQFRALAAFTLIAAVASAVSSIPDSGTASPRLTGPQGETANVFGGYLALHIALALGFFLNSRERGLRLWAAGAAVVLAYPLLLTYSRSAFTALAAVCTFHAFAKDRRLLIILGITGLLLPVIAPDAIWQRLLSISGLASGDEPSSWTSRVYAWSIYVPRVLEESPLLGFGIASQPLGEIDNEYVRVLVDTGLAGLAAFLWILSRWGRAALRLPDALPAGTAERGFAVGYGLAFGAMLVHAIASTSFTAIRTMEAFMVMSGLFAALHHRWPAWHPDHASDRSQVLVAEAEILNPQGRPAAPAFKG